MHVLMQEANEAAGRIARQRTYTQRELVEAVNLAIDRAIQYEREGRYAHIKPKLVVGSVEDRHLAAHCSRPVCSKCREFRMAFIRDGKPLCSRKECL